MVSTTYIFHMTPSLKNHLELHFIVLIYGFTAILGRLISLQAEMLVGWRMLITVLALSVVMFSRQTDFKIPKRLIWHYSSIGVVVALHWITFFHAIKIANISVALGGLASTTLFASLLEPLLLRRRFRLLELLIGLLIIGGLYLIFRFETRYFYGILTAVTSAFLAALFTVMNKKFIQRDACSPLVIGSIEMGSGFLAILLYLTSTGLITSPAMIPSPIDWFWLGLLAIVCTAYPYIATIGLMKHLSAYTVTLSVNMEPVYGILMAYFIFGQSEMMTTGFYAGTGIILVSVFIYPILLKFFYQSSNTSA